MNRFTQKDKEGHISIDEKDMGLAMERLFLFENAWEDLVNMQQQIPEQLEEMRLSGKEKTLKFKETMAQKLINNNVAVFFSKHGII